MRFSLADTALQTAMYNVAADVEFDLAGIWTPAAAADTDAAPSAAPPQHLTASIDPEFVRGGTGPNGKPSFTIDQAGVQISRGGWTVNGYQVLGHAATLTYGFRSTLNVGGEATFSRATADEIVAAETALAAWADVANLTFVRVGTGTTGDAAYTDDAQVLIGNYNRPGAPEAAYAGGSILWVNAAYVSTGYWNLFNYGSNLLIHELGHNLGLSHPGDYAAGSGSPTYAANASYFEDSRQYSVMSYWGESETGAAFNFHFAAAPLMDDIAAIQRLYGANLTARTGDTVYGFNGNADKSWYTLSAASDVVIFCVWDTGGIDTLDFSGYAQNAVVDLRAGHFSSVGGQTGNVSIAQGVIIEKATGGTGNDTLIGNAADNWLDGGAGDDSLMGGAGSDIAVYRQATAAITVNLSQAGAHLIGGGQGSDTMVDIEGLFGSRFSDSLTGDGNDNRLEGWLGDDTLDGGAGSDIAMYTAATAGVTISLAVSGGQAVGGGQGTDVLISIEGLVGSAFDDMLTGDGGNNSLAGGAGNDQLDGAGGSDSVSYVLATTGVTVDLALTAAQAIGGGEGLDTLISIENLTGSAFDDWLRGSTGDNVINGGAGLDTLSFTGATGPITINLALSTGQAVGGGQGTDTYTGIEAVIGTAFGDTLTGGTGDDRLTGAAGNDTLAGGLGIDTVVYSDASGAVTIDLTAGTAIGGGGTDAISQFEAIVGSAFDDVLTGDNGNNRLDGGAGNDTLYSGGSDALFGGAGEAFYGGEGDDSLFSSGVAKDVFYGGGGNDTVNFATSGGAVSIDLDAETPIASATDILVGIEAVIGTDFGDQITGNSATQLILAGDGYDRVTINGTLTAAARIDGGSGGGSLDLNGDYGAGLVLNDTTISHFANLSLDGLHDYNLTLADGNVDAGTTMYVSYANSPVSASGDLIFDGSAETNGNFGISVSAGHNVLSGGAGADNFYFSGYFKADDVVDGGAGYDWLYLYGNYGASSLAFKSTTIRNIDGIVMQGSFTYRLTMNDGNVAAGASLWVYGGYIESAGRLVFDGSRETNGSFTIDGGAGADDLRGGRGNDFLRGAGGNDVFRFGTGGGNDTIADFSAGDSIDVSGAGGFQFYQTLVQSGADVIITFAANTALRVSNTTVASVSGALVLADLPVINGTAGNDTVNGTASAETINGLAGDDVLNGLAGYDVINGGDGNDLIDGGPGNDTMIGGKGGDIYVVDQVGDQVVEAAGEGTDIIRTEVSFTMSANVERMVLTGTAGIAGTGNDLANQITGNAGNNLLDGGLGADTLLGAAGNDRYLVDNAGDRVFENANEGNDSVSAGFSYSLGTQYVENLTLTGTADLTATGNALANTLIGNSGNNVLNGGNGIDNLWGGAGNDTYYIDNIADRTFEKTTSATDAGGHDVVYASVRVVLDQYVEDLVITGTANLAGTGNALDNSLTGNSSNNALLGKDGNDILDGGAGADTLAGGLGNDTYLIDNVLDRVAELNNQGYDTVYSSVSFNLGNQFVETLTLTGEGNINATGNAIANYLSGNDAANTLDGGRGNDTLQGRGGADVFVFGLLSGADTITDFSAVDGDSINLHAWALGVVNGGGIVITQVGADTVVTLGGGNSVTLLNTVQADLIDHIVW